MDSLSHFFAAAASDLGKASVDAETVRRVWNRIVPGMDILKLRSAQTDRPTKPIHTGSSSMTQGTWMMVAGLLDSYDVPMSLPCIAPRPLMVAMGGEDPRCPLQGRYIFIPMATIPIQPDAHLGSIHRFMRAMSGLSKYMLYP